MKELIHLEDTIVYMGMNKIFITKYKDRVTNKIYCYDSKSLNPVHFNGGIGEEKQGRLAFDEGR